MDAALDDPDRELTIGEVAERAGLATSAVRYYERRGLIAPDARRSGQRRYRTGTLRRLVFIRMLQDSGLSLEEIDGILHASSKEQWKSIAKVRLAGLTREIEELEEARARLETALLCRFDHPLDECAVMGAEIDRRLGAGSTIGG